MKMRSTLPLLLLLPFVAGCTGSKAEQQKSGNGARRSLEFPVEVAAVAAQPVEYVVTAVGSVDAFERVEVTSRVSGVVEHVRFREGRSVRAGEVLVEIEPERFRLAVRAAEANVAKALATKAEAEAGLARRHAASEKNPGLIRGEEIETWRTRALTAAAEVSQMRAALDQAKLNLRDAFVRAPISGTIQTRTVQTGQFVQPGAVLATLVRRDPLLLRFEVPETDSARLRPGMRIRFRVSETPEDFGALIRHVAESASSTTRMVALTAEIDDPKRASLKPGAFARVTVPVGGTIAAPVIPQTAIRPSERGFLAFVVEGDTARERILDLGMRTPDGRVEVKAGLKPGDRLVIRGAEALRDGAKVKVSSESIVSSNGARSAQPDA